MSLMTTMMAQVVRMQPGDLLWVRLGPNTDVDDVETVRDAVVEAMPLECSVILTQHDLVERLGVASLDDLIELRRVIDQAIDSRSSRTTHEA